MDSCRPAGISCIGVQLKEIVREGTTKKIRFVCTECDCIFDADLGEAKVTRQGHKNSPEYKARYLEPEKEFGLKTDDMPFC